LKRGKPIERKTEIKRTEFKRKPPKKNRAKHKRVRDKYRAENPICFWDGCNSPATETDHIVPKGGDSYEHVYLWFPICHRHHLLKGTDNKRYVLEQIEMQLKRGLYFADAREEYEFFGFNIYFDGRDR
jgi:hypothetical protein